jgi:aspartyl-tRNA(Asn)/glutamyl-tRNA(Gln) amidotransferase subunit B
MEQKKFNLEQLMQLSGLELQPDEKETLNTEMEKFLQYAEVIQSWNEHSHQSAHHPVLTENPFREDIVCNNFGLKSIDNIAPAIQDGGYLIPPIKNSSSTKSVKANKPQNIQEYEAVIGLEVHAQLKTTSKLFCACSTKFSKQANINTCPVCAGHPGSLPVLNKQAVEMAIKAGLAMHCSISLESVFVRKNYFYPDSPKAYQISQLEKPLCKNGYITIGKDDQEKNIRINRIHMEEDAGKMVHVGAPGIWGAKASAVDFNRTGIPLIEIVSEPDISNASQAKRYLMLLRAILTTLDVCDGNMEEGSLRCDANVSIRPKGSNQLGIKTEIKNMNSFKAVERAIEFEIERQKNVLNEGKNIIQETRLWDENKQKTLSMRSKEDSHDYRYFPEPDLLPVHVSQEKIRQLRETLPTLPRERSKLYEQKFSLQHKEIQFLIQNPRYGEYLEEANVIAPSSLKVAQSFFNELLPLLDTTLISDFPANKFADFLSIAKKQGWSKNIRKQFLQEAIQTKESLDELCKQTRWQQNVDQKQIFAWIQEAIAAHPKSVQDYQAGKVKSLDYLVGQVMKKSRGKAHPKKVRELLESSLAGVH